MANEPKTGGAIVSQPTNDLEPRAKEIEPERVTPTYDPASGGYTWWIRCAQGHVAAMGKGAPPVGQILSEVAYEQPKRRYALPKRYAGSDTCWACGGVLPTDGIVIATQYLVQSPPPPYDSGGYPIPKDRR